LGCCSTVILVRIILDFNIRYNLCSSGTSSTRLSVEKDKYDDLKVGIKSTALQFGQNTNTILAGLTICQFYLLATAGINMDVGGPFFAGLALAGIWQTLMLKFVDVDRKSSCAAWFVRNIYTGGLIFLGCAAEWLVRLHEQGMLSLPEFL